MMGGRLQGELLDRVVDYGQRILTLAEQLEADRRPRRLVDQLIGSGTAVGANLFEAHEAMSRADFLRCLAIAAKELHETVFWIRLLTRKQYLMEDRLSPLLEETGELLAIVKSIIGRSRTNTSGK